MDPLAVGYRAGSGDKIIHSCYCITILIHIKYLKNIFYWVMSRNELLRARIRIRLLRDCLDRIYFYWILRNQ